MAMDGRAGGGGWRETQRHRQMMPKVAPPALVQIFHCHDLDGSASSVQATTLFSHFFDSAVPGTSDRGLLSISFLKWQTGKQKAQHLVEVVGGRTYWSLSNGPQVVPNWSPSGLQVVSKWSPSGPQLVSSASSL